NQDLVDKMLARRNVLTITNTKAEADKIFELLGPADGHFYLSSRLYPKHRRKILAKIKEHLKHNDVCRVVSTSLVEAGVDVDFDDVFRAISGLDNIAQAAGRSNREGKNIRGFGEVFIYMPETGLPKRAPSFNRRFAAAKPLLEKAENFLAPQTQKQYFKNLYLGEENLDTPKILKKIQAVSAASSTYPFKELAQDYRFIDNEEQSIIIVHKQDAEALSLVEKLRHKQDLKATLRQLQNFTVTIYSYECQALIKAGALECLHEQFWVTSPFINFYDDYCGLRVQGQGQVDDSAYIIGP
ncbi:MAG: hypothetical protein ACRCTY_07980, partial [Candidatus Adiutrix sp.]